MSLTLYCLYTFNFIHTALNVHNPNNTIVNCNFGFLLILDVQNVFNKCSVEKPCEVNAGNCSFDSECRGNLICTQNDCKGSTFSLYSKCCQEPGDDIFYISTWFTNYYKMVDILFYYFLLYIVPKKTSFKECCFIYLEFSVSIEL